MVDLWPALSKHFGLHPWDLERLTYAEIESYRNALQDIARAHRQQ